MVANLNTDVNYRGKLLQYFYNFGPCTENKAAYVLLIEQCLLDNNAGKQLS
jgi:hypothetical protein